MAPTVNVNEAVKSDVPAAMAEIELDMASSLDRVEINQGGSTASKNCIQDLLGWLRMPKFSKWCLFICIAFAVVVIAAFIIYTDLSQGTSHSPSPSPHPYPPEPQKAPFLKEYFLYHSIAPQLFNGTFITGKDFYYYDSFRNLVVLNLENGRSDIVLPFTSWILLNGTFNFWFSEDLKYMMYASYHTPIYRHSYYAIYQVYNFRERKSTYITQNSLQLAVMAPGSNAVAYVDKNNIFYRANPEDESSDIRLTADGVPGKIYNGVPDWVYEEEIISSNQAMWFSKNGSHLAYFKFNDSTVLIQAIPVYGPPNLRQWQYTRYDQIHYPKVGTPNPTVSVHVVPVANLTLDKPPKVYSFPAPVEFLDNKEPIASRLAWANDTQFVVVWMNRYQNKLVMELCSVQEETPCRTLFQQSESSGWLELQEPRFDASGNRMAYLWWHKQSNGDSYQHVTLLSLNYPDAKPTPITFGDFSVTEISGWDLETDEIYFLSSESKTPEKLFVSKVAAQPPHQVTCLSCSHPHGIDGSNCSYAGAVVSPNAHFYALSCAGPSIPEVTIFDRNGTEVMMWEDNSKTRQMVEKLTMPVKKILDIPAADGFIARVQLLLPPELAEFDKDKDYGKKYPMLVNVYAGPDSSLVKDMFSTDFNTFMVANKSIIGVSIDGRGNNLRGLKARYAIYKNLGNVEVDDQLAVIKYLQDNYAFIDRNRTASWGWSYGGYTTGMMLAEDREDRIKCGVSIAPVTDWVYYDSIYTERFMLTYEENLQGYMRASLLNRAIKLKNKTFFLIHGTKDDNVHYQNSMQLAKLLARSDVPFRQMTYPDEDHALKFVQPHFYHAIEDFLEECFFEEES